MPIMSPIWLRKYRYQYSL